MSDSPLSKKLKNIIQPIMRNQDYAKFGDSLTNFLYSVAKTNVLHKPCGERVYDAVLAEALKQANLRSIMPSSVSAGILGDGVEALIGYVYLEKICTIQELINLLEASLKEKSSMLKKRKQEKILMKNAFQKVLEYILKKLRNIT
ncbi:MAG: ribonuclease III family protein [Asgard group archaeon]|nr:ribonuclease III family protein [Asgard group archaeon]